MIYDLFFRTVFRRMDPERAHHLAFVVIRLLPGFLKGFSRPDRSLAVDALGVRFPSPFGLAAGFDKEAAGIRGLSVLGFGHVEVGTITALPQPGNPRPRLFRLIPDRAVINRMGFNNAGAEAAARRLQKVRGRFRNGRDGRARLIVGVNIGKSRVVAVEDALDDYLTSTRLLAPHADYLVVNVSSPNTPGLRGLQELDKLAPLLEAVRDAAGGVPVLVKIAPDLSDEQVRRIADLSIRLGLPGIVATNTTISRAGLTSDRAMIAAAGEGGLSGAPLAARSLEVLRVLRAAVPKDFVIVSVGGVETADDVAERLAAGATLVQGYTAFLYRGPLWARSINRGLLRRATSSDAAGDAPRRGTGPA